MTYFNDLHQALFCILLSSKHTFSQDKPNFIIVSSETPFSKNSYNTETSQLIYKVRSLIRFYMVRVFTEGYFGRDQNTLFIPQKSELIVIIPVVLSSRCTQSIDIVFVNRVY